MDPGAGGLTVGDRLGRIENRLDQLVSRMETLAQQADVRALDTRLDIIEREGSVLARRAESDVTGLAARVTSLETERAVFRALRSNRRLVVGVVLGMAGWASVVVAGAALWHR